MTYFADGTPYDYFSSESPLVCVGWLGEGQTFETGACPPGFLDRLAWFCVNQNDRATRGIHYCEICSNDETKQDTEFGGGEFQSAISLHRADQTRLLGTAEITIDAGERIYAAPNLILHYVAGHFYLPPEDFVRAVMDQEESCCLTDWSLVAEG